MRLGWLGTWLVLMAGCAEPPAPKGPPQPGAPAPDGVYGAAADLAARCETVPWRVPWHSSDLVPAALREIQRELREVVAGGAD